MEERSSRRSITMGELFSRVIHHGSMAVVFRKKQQLMRNIKSSWISVHIYPSVTKCNMYENIAY
jgi:hypothetical protein